MKTGLNHCIPCIGLIRIWGIVLHTLQWSARISGKVLQPLQRSDLDLSQDSATPAKVCPDFRQGSAAPAKV